MAVTNLLENGRYWILVTGYWMLDTGFSILVSRCWQNRGRFNPDIRRSKTPFYGGRWRFIWDSRCSAIFKVKGAKHPASSIEYPVSSYFSIARSSIKNSLPSFSTNFLFLIALPKSGFSSRARLNSFSACKNKLRH